MNRLFLALGLAGALLAGCRKADVVLCEPAAVAQSASLRDFFRRNGAPTQTFAVALGGAAASSLPQVLTKGGATLRLNGSPWLLPNGTIASGQAEMRVREIYSVADMVLSDMPTDQPYQRNMLVSGGEFNVQVRLGGQRLRLSPTGTLEVRSPIPPDQDTTRQLIWNRPAVGASGSSGLVDSTGWLLANAPAVQQMPSPFPMPTGYYQAFLPLDSIGWWNIDQYWHQYSGVATAPVTVATPATAAANTRVYLRPLGVNGLARLAPLSASGDAWRRNLPVGTPHLAVVLQLRNGQLYYGTQALTVQGSGNALAPSLAPVTESQAVQLIRQL